MFRDPFLDNIWSTLKNKKSQDEHKKGLLSYFKRALFFTGEKNYFLRFYIYKVPPIWEAERQKYLFLRE